MVTKQFKIKPKKKCTIQNVGLRPALVSSSLRYNVKVCPINNRDGSVTLKIKGKDNDVSRYLKALRENKIKAPIGHDIETGKCVDFKVGKAKEVKEMSDTDFDYCVDALQLRQSEKGVKTAKQLLKIMLED